MPNKTAIKSPHSLNVVSRGFPFFSPTNTSPSYTIPDMINVQIIVERIKKYGADDYLKDVVLVGRQHLLETTERLLDCLYQIGLKPENTFLLGKAYSTSPDVEQEIKKRGANVYTDGDFQSPYYQNAAYNAAKRMWAIVEKKIKTGQIILVLDDGGLCVQTIPPWVFKHPTAFVEQTRGGLYNEEVQHCLFPGINVAASAVKRIIEPPMIAYAAMKQVKSFLARNPLPNHARCGVIGNGAIGSAIANMLLKHEKHFLVFVYDDNEEAFRTIVNRRLYRVDSRETLISNADFIFGCTGKDVTEDILNDAKSIIESSKRNKTFFSVSSENREFRALLCYIYPFANNASEHVFSDIIYRNHFGARITLVMGGFPINFDRQPGNVPPEDIAITQALLFVGLLQAKTLAMIPLCDGKTMNKPSQKKLAARLQRLALNVWYSLYTGNSPSFPSPECIKQFDSLDWITRNSGGEAHIIKSEHKLNGMITFLESILFKPPQPNEDNNEVNRLQSRL